MIRKVFIVILFFVSISSSFAVQIDPISMDVSFTSGLVANFGFSTYPPDSAIKPESSVPSVIEFTYNDRTGNYETPTYYIYYQVFTPVNAPLKVSVVATGLRNINDSNDILVWNDREGNIKCIENPDAFDNPSPHKTPIESNLTIDREPANYDSKAFKLEVNASEVNYDAAYRGQITVYIES